MEKKGFNFSRTKEKPEVTNQSEAAIKKNKHIRIYEVFDEEPTSTEKLEVVTSISKSVEEGGEVTNKSKPTKINETIPKKVKYIKIWEEVQEEIKGEVKEKVRDIVIKCSVEEMAKKFVKDYKIIWYDPIINSTQNINYVNILKDKHSLEKFNTWEEAATFIQTNKLPSFVITSGINIKEFIKKIHPLNHVRNIYIFNESMRYDLKLFNYDKVICEQNAFSELYQNLNEDIKQWQKTGSAQRIDLPAFVPIFTSQDISSFNKIFNYLTRLISLKNRNQAKQDFLDLSKLVSDDNENINKFQEEYKEYDMKKILYWYTIESFLYVVLNNCLRIATSDSVLYCRLIINDLQQAIEGQYIKESKNFHGIVYRAAYISDSELQNLQENIGKDIQMHGFISTSKIRENALRFLGNDSRKALITIIIPGAGDKLGNKGFAELKEYSEFPEEDEVLFNIMSRFRVLNVYREVIDGIEHHNIILLYGVYQLRKFLYKSKLSFKINLVDSKRMICLKCGLKYESKKENEPWFLDIIDQTKSMCQTCLKKTNIGDKNVMLMILSLNFLDKTKEIKGIGMEPIELDHLKKARLRCAKCKNDGIYLELTYQCINCGSIQVILCAECSIKMVNECQIKEHAIIVHKNNLNIWFEEMADSEYIYSQMLDEIILENDDFREGKAFSEEHSYNRAIQFYEEYLKQTTDKLMIGGCYGNIGLVYSKKGEYDKAIEYYMKSLKISQESLGEIHPDTATSYNNIGTAYSGKGEYDKAIEYHMKSLKIKQEILGKTHPSIATYYNNIGIAYYSKGEYDKAIEYYMKSLKISQESIGETHPSTAAYYSNIGLVYSGKGEYDKAIEYYMKSLKIRQESLGETHPNTATSYDNIGTAYSKKGEHDKAIEYYMKSLKIRQESLGETHPSTATSYNNIGLAYYNKGEYDKTIEYHMKSLKIRQESLGETHPDTATSYDNIGTVYYYKGKYGKAIEYHMKSLKIKQESLGETHPSTATSYNNIGIAYSKKGEHDKAIEYHMKSLKIYQESLGETHPDTATSYNNIGLIYSGKGEYDKAIEYYMKSLKISQERLGETHPDTAITYNNIGTAYSNKGEYDKAIEYYMKSLKISEESLGETHPDIAAYYNNIGTAYLKKGEYDKAIEYYMKSLKISQESLGETHPDTAAYYKNISISYYSKGEYDKAIKYHMK